ncbi:VOC family protein [Herbaspirillum sp. RV1423]|uniref:2-oxoadipate dioxygenase/decarboxylase HglS n=1 Tax=Herbaspirillum sp. RV1423 TaxID=1443993 RepID=UPI0004B3F1F6|nr:VOC family protein [Herbaspirillum sp. RV1423]
MNTPNFISPDEIRAKFSMAMSGMYRAEVPQYGTLLELVGDINRSTLEDDVALRKELLQTGELDRIDVERHGAIRLGTERELATMRRIFKVMGMHPVGYYDLSVAGVPVHATAFRPIEDTALRFNPFRVFTSLLRLELIENEELREEARQLLVGREIFTPMALSLLAQAEKEGGLHCGDADQFIAEVTKTFSWHSEATVSSSTYQKLLGAHRLIADVVCFKGPHINHLTPRTLDIDAAQLEMPRRGIKAKDLIEGPPRRRCPILLRQTSFKALVEAIAFKGDSDAGTHTARFGEIEQRGVALTRKGRALYDQLLAKVRSMDGSGNTATDYESRLQAVFSDFPDDYQTLHTEELAFFRYAIVDEEAFAAATRGNNNFNLKVLIKKKIVGIQPIIYEDFLPVSAAGIFQSNLGGNEQKDYVADSAQGGFEQALQAPVLDEFVIYEKSRQLSLDSLKFQFEKTKSLSI